MEENSEEKKTFWAPIPKPVSQSEQETFNEKKLKHKQASTLSKLELEFAEQLKEHLDLGLLNLLFFKLDSLTKAKKLHKFIAYNNYYLFDWALENKNLLVLTYLLEKLSKEQAFVMVSYHDYAAFKKFIIAVAKYIDLHNTLDDTYGKLLEAILKIQPNWQMKDIIKNNIDLDVVEKLQPYLADNLAAVTKPVLP